MGSSSNSLELKYIMFAEFICPVAINPFLDTIKIIAKEDSQIVLRNLLPFLNNLFSLSLIYADHFT